MTRGGLGEHRLAAPAGLRAGDPLTAGRQVRPVFDHLAALTDDRGLFEHALHSAPRPEHGYCVDDAARGLVVTCREPRPSPVVQGLRSRYLRFVLSALCPDGTCHNRFDREGRLQDEAGLGDWWGRTLWALGVAAAVTDTASMRSTALVGFRVAAQQRSPYSRSMAFAALGAGELLRVAPGQSDARKLLRDAMEAVAAETTVTSRDWPWPEPRLRYANATVAEVISYAQPERVANAPKWLLGRLSWRGWRLPLFSFPMLTGEVADESYTNARVAVLKALGGNAKMPFLALLAQGFPRLTTITPDSLIPTGDENAHPLGIRAEVLVRDDRAVIPDIGLIEGMVAEAIAA